MSEDIAALIAALRREAGHWAPRLFPAGRAGKGEWRLANIKGDPPRKAGSCVLKLEGPHAGDWYDFARGEGGGPLRAIAAATGLEGKALLDHAGSLVGWRRPEKPRVAAEKSWDWRRLLAEAQSLEGSPAASYLAGRGLHDLEGAADLLFHPHLFHGEEKRAFPAMLARLRDGSGAIVGLHRTYLEKGADGNFHKAAIAHPKLMLGRAKGAMLRLGEIGADGRLAIAEGIETALALRQALPDLAVYAALSAGNLAALSLPASARSILIAADCDPQETGAKAAARAAQRFREEGRRVEIALPKEMGADFNDLWRAGGKAAILAVLAPAEARLAEETVADSDSASAEPRALPLSFPAARLRPRLRADEGDLAAALAQTWRVIADANRAAPFLFRMGDHCVWIARDETGAALIQPLDEDRWLYLLARLADWRRAKEKPAYPPLGLIRALLATPDPDLPPLAGLTAAPVFDKAGLLLDRPGYQESARLFYQPAAGFALPPISARPSPAEIEAARRLLLEDFLGDFPFTGEAERAHAMALLLLGFLRPAISGPTPLHLIEKPTPGTGATLLVEAIAALLTGEGATLMTEGRDDEEWRKRITAKLRQGPGLILIDNLRRPLDSGALAAALTAPFWEDRLLGQSAMTRLPIRSLWVATGNNPDLSSEMSRRLIRIRLDARCDRPWLRGGFRHEALAAWTKANRARLIGAALTLIQAWVAAGRPKGEKKLGAFEAWSAAIGGVLGIAGIPGFLGNLDDLAETGDGESASWRAFIAAWWAERGEAETGVNALYGAALSAEPPLNLGSGNERAQRTKLGQALMRQRDRMFETSAGPLRLTLVRKQERALLWRLAPAADLFAPQSQEPPEPPEPLPPHPARDEKVSRQDFRQASG